MNWGEPGCGVSPSMATEGHSSTSHPTDFSTGPLHCPHPPKDKVEFSSPLNSEPEQHHLSSEPISEKGTGVPCFSWAAPSGETRYHRRPRTSHPGETLSVPQTYQHASEVALNPPDQPTRIDAMQSSAPGPHQRPPSSQQRLAVSAAVQARESAEVGC